MGSKSRNQYVSKGIVGRPMRTPIKGKEKILNRVNAWKAGKPVKISIPREYDEKTGKMKGSGEPKVWAHEEWGSPFRKPKREKDEVQSSEGIE